MAPTNDIRASDGSSGSGFTRLLCGAEKSFRVNPSSLIYSGAVVRRIRAAKLSEIGAFSTRCRPSYLNRTYERDFF